LTARFLLVTSMGAPKFHADFFELPDGTATAVIRSEWPLTDDSVEVLRRSVRRDPQRTDPFLRKQSRNCGGDS
jgi:hypothetical protein